MDSGNMFCGVTNHASLFGLSDGWVWICLMPGECYLPGCIVPTIEFGRAGIMIWELGYVFYFQWREIMLQHTNTFWTMMCFQIYGNALGKALFYSSMTEPQCTTHTQTKSIKTRLDQFVMEGLNWPTLCPDLNSIKHFWDEMCVCMCVCVYI